MNRLLLSMVLVLTLMSSCKTEHPDLKSAQILFNEAKELKQNILTSKVELLNQAKMIDSRIRNEDKENVFTISEVYNHLESVDKGLREISKPRSVPGHEKEAEGIPAIDPKTVPAQVLMIQKNYKDSLQLIKNDIDAASTLINTLKTKIK